MNFLDLRVVQKCVLYRSGRELSNEYLLSKIDFDTAENEPSKVICLYFDTPQNSKSKYSILSIQCLLDGLFIPASLTNHSRVLQASLRGSLVLAARLKASSAVRGARTGAAGALPVPARSSRLATDRTKSCFDRTSTLSKHIPIKDTIE